MSCDLSLYHLIFLFSHGSTRTGKIPSCLKQYSCTRMGMIENQPFLWPLLPEKRRYQQKAQQLLPDTLWAPDWRKKPYLPVPLKKFLFWYSALFCLKLHPTIWTGKRFLTCSPLHLHLPCPEAGSKLPLFLLSSHMVKNVTPHPLDVQMDQRTMIPRILKEDSSKRTSSLHSPLSVRHVTFMPVSPLPALSRSKEPFESPFLPAWSSVIPLWANESEAASSSLFREFRSKPAQKHHPVLWSGKSFLPVPLSSPDSLNPRWIKTLPFSASAAFSHIVHLPFKRIKQGWSHAPISSRMRSIQGERSFSGDRRGKKGREEKAEKAIRKEERKWRLIHAVFILLSQGYLGKA